MVYNLLLDVLTERNQLPLQTASDYRQYRVRATRRLARTKKDLGVQKRPVKGGPRGPLESRRRVPFKPPTLEDTQENPELVRVLVSLAERSWAHAMETRSVLETNFSSSKKTHVRSKLSKACKYIDFATTLVRQISQSDDSYFGTLQVLQLEAYSLLLHGALAFQTNNYEKCITSYSLARVSLEAFSGSEISTPAIKDNIEDLISTIVDPSLTFAHYRLTKIRPLSASGVAVKAAQQAKTHPVIPIIEKIDASLLDLSLAEGSAASRLDTVSWRKYEASIQDKELAASLFKTVSKDKDLESEINTQNGKLNVESSLALFDNILQSWQNSRDMVKANIERLESFGGSSSDKEVQDQYVVSTYVGYHLLLRRIQRDVLLLKRADSRISASLNNDSKKGKKTSTKTFEKMKEIVRLYDTILQSTSELRDLRGVHTDNELSASLQSLDSFYKAERLNLLARAYHLVSRFEESLALYGKSLALLSSASQSLSVDFAGILDQSKFQRVLAETNSKTLQLRAQLTIRPPLGAHNADAMDIDGEEQKGKKTAVVDNLQQYALSTLGSAEEVAKNLVNLNATLQPVFSKPVFFDVAYNFLNQPAPSTDSSVSTEEPTAASSKDKKKSGGFLRGLLGR